jgi:hypothetical protein
MDHTAIIAKYTPSREWKKLHDVIDKISDHKYIYMLIDKIKYQAEFYHILTIYGRHLNILKYMARRQPNFISIIDDCRVYTSYVRRHLLESQVIDYNLLDSTKHNEYVRDGAGTLLNMFPHLLELPVAKPYLDRHAGIKHILDACILPEIIDIILSYTVYEMYVNYCSSLIR